MLTHEFLYNLLTNDETNTRNVSIVFFEREDENGCAELVFGFPVYARTPQEIHDIAYPMAQEIAREIGMPIRYYQEA